MVFNAYYKSCARLNFTKKETPSQKPMQNSASLPVMEQVEIRHSNVGSMLCNNA